MFIYKATNVINNKIYIGKCAKSLDKRKYEHKWNAENNGRGYKSKFYNAIRKYGFDKFSWEIIEDGIKNEVNLNTQEKFYIKQLDTIKNGYNISEGGNGGDNFTNHPLKEEIRDKISKATKGLKRSEEFKKQNRERQIGRIISPETLEKRSEALKGRIITQEWKDKISKSLKGRKLNSSTKEKISQSLKGRQLSEEHKAKIGKSRLGKKQTKETRLKISEKLKGREISSEWKRKISESNLGKHEKKD
jgi:group I intron endonuclease